MRRGRRGDGTVYYSHADRRWVARWPLGIVDGKRQAKRLTARTEREARAKLETLRRTYGAGAIPSTATLDTYLGEWLQSHGPSVRPSTLTSYRGHVDRWISPLLGGIPLRDLAPRDVRRLVAAVGKERKPGTVHLVHRTLHAALQAAVDERVIPDNPARGIPLPRIDREPVRALTADERDAILDATAGTWIERPVRVLLGSGMRLGELVGLDQGDVQDGYVRVRRTKTRVRAVPCSRDAIDALRESIAQAPRIGPDEPVFWGRRSDSRYNRLLGSSVTHALPRILAAAGRERLAPHALRHGAATIMLAGGASMRVIAEQLGHRNPALTARIYAHVVPESQRAAVDLLERRGAR